MTPRPVAAPARRQSGVYLIAIAVLLGIAVTLLTYGAINDMNRRNISGQSTADALEQAKQALIGYAATYRDTHAGEVFGYLPCPDSNDGGNEGAADTGTTECASKDVTAIGRLPWRTLDLPPLRDSSGECLWYAVSGNFKASVNKTDLMNWDTNGLIEVMQPDGTGFVAGSAPTNRAAAVIFSPGPILPGQDRSLGGATPPEICGGNYDPANYLDTDVASGINNATASSATANAKSRFIAALDSDRTSATNDSFNDRLVAILPEEIFARRIDLRSDLHPMLTASATGLSLPNPSIGMLPVAADCLARYGMNNNSAGDRRLPWAAPIALVPAIYGNSNNYTEATGSSYSGRLPMFVPTSDSATNNNLVTAVTGLRLLDGSVCGGWPTVDEFWGNWKDHVFYAVSKAFAPNSTVASSANPCSLDECIRVDGTGAFAAVLIFAGKKQAGQSRNNDANPSYASAEKSLPSNYLEGANATAILNNSPSMASPRNFTKLAGDDIVMCVNFNPGSPSSLSVDSTCGASTVCAADGDSLAAYRVGNANACKVGKDGVLPACKVIEDRIHKNDCTCHKAGHEFNNKECIKGFTTQKCIDAHTSLVNC